MINPNKNTVNIRWINNSVILPAILLISTIYAENLIINGETISLSGSHHYDNVIITNSGVLSLIEHDGIVDSLGTLLLYCDSLYIDGTSSINGDGKGGEFGFGVGDNGNGAGQFYAGGGGGGFGGDGGNGGTNTNNDGIGGLSYGNITSLNRGSCGGYGYGANNSNFDFQPGKGGGGIYIESSVVNIEGSISSNGTNASWPGTGFGGSGGGSGGMIWIDAYNISIAGDLSTNGGNGSGYQTSNNIYGGGGGGGGGRITIVSETQFDIESNQIEYNGGIGGPPNTSNYDTSEPGEGGEFFYFHKWLTSTTHPDTEKWSLNASPIISLNAIGDIFGYFYILDQDSSTQVNSSSTFTQQNSLSLGILEQGSWFFHAIPMDSSYNLIDSLEMTHKLNIHTEPIGVTSQTHSSSNIWYENSNPTFNFETMSGISEYFFIFNQDSLTIPTAENGTYFDNDFILIPNVSNGVHWLHLVGLDYTGNLSENPSHFRIHVGAYPGPIYYVSTTGSDENDGSEESPFTTIQKGIDLSSGGDTVLVQPGTYVENINYNGKNIVVGSLMLTTQDTSYISSTIIDGNQSGSVVTFESGEDSTATLIGLTVQNGTGQIISGYGNTSGGGIVCNNSNPTIKNLIIKNNTAYRGGGIFLNISNPTIIGITIKDNNVQGNGGGMHCFQSPPTLFKNSIINTNNAIQNGGGIYLHNSTYNLDNVSVSNNTANLGAGFQIEDAGLVFSNGSITNNSSNTAQEGSGIRAEDATINILNSLIAENSIPNSNGGGISLLRTSLELVNSTVVANQGGLYFM